jgi:hypothetical protein
MSIDPTLTPYANLLVNEHKRRRARERWHGWWGRLAAAGALVAVVAALVAIPTGKADSLSQEKDQVSTKLDSVGQVANVSADNTLALCLRDDEAAKKLAASGLCELARQLKAAAAAATVTPKQGAQGISGKDGRGIAATAIVDGHFQVTYSDGTTEDKGLIKGKDGAPGRGITGSTIANGHLTLIYSDGATEDVGQVVGKDGVNGDDGKPGRGIAGITQKDGDLIISYTDGTSQDVGPLPKGRDGQPPVSWVENYADGRTMSCERAPNFDADAPKYVCNETSPPPPPETTTVTQTTTAGLLGRP